MIQNNIEYIEEIQDLTYELMTAFHSGVSWLIVYCEENNLPMPDLDRARTLITTSGYVLENSEFINRRVTQRNTNREGNSTKKIKSYILRYFIVR
jgi:hypothetical protein